MSIPNGHNPHVYSVGLGKGLGATAVIIGGVSGSTAAILTEVGLPAEGSMYIGTKNGAFVAFVVNGVWTRLTIN